MGIYNTYIVFLIALKIMFLLLALLHFYNRRQGKMNTKQDKVIVYWKTRIEFIFTIGMAILLIYVFSPRRRDKNIITHETKVLFFLFGIILIVTAKWENFIETSNWFKQVQTALK